MWELSKEEIEVKLEDLKNQVMEMNTSTVMGQGDSEENYKIKGQMKAAIDALDKERRKLSLQMNQAKMVEATVLYVNPLTNEKYLCDLAAGDKVVSDYFTLYPLDVFGTHYVLARPQMIYMYQKN